jgi:sugar-specific transcriptional regulator TrmB
MSGKNQRRILSEFGLSDHESRIYEALVRYGPSTMSELAQKASVPRTKVYINVKKLEKRGFVEFLPDKPSRCRAISPEVILEPILQEKQTEVASMKEQLNTLVELFKQIQDVDGVERKEFWTIRQRQKALKALKDEIRQAKQEVIMVLNRGGFRLLLEAYDELRKARENGTKNRVIASYVFSKDLSVVFKGGKGGGAKDRAKSGTEDSTVLEELSKIEGLSGFADIRLMPYELSDSIVLVDSSACLIMSSSRVTEGVSNFSSVYVREPRMTENIRSIINSVLWDNLPKIENVMTLIRSSDDPVRAIKAASSSIYSNAVIYSFGKWIIENYGEKKGDEILRKIAANAIKILEKEEGVRLVKNSVEESLKLITDLASISEQIEVDFSSEDPLKSLLYAVTGASSVSYKGSQDIKSSLLMTAWGLLSEAIFDKFGYETTTVQTVYDQSKDLWIVRKKVFKKGTNPIKSLDQILDELQASTKKFSEKTEEKIEDQKSEDGQKQEK